MLVKNIEYDRSTYSDEDLIKLYRYLLLPRMIEEKMLSLLRQGVVSKWFSGIGQEAISVGCVLGIDREEAIFTKHRNLGVFTGRNVPLRRLISQWQGKEGGFTHGRDRSFHFGTPEHNIYGMISHLGTQQSVAAGVALAYKLRNEKKVSLVFTGDGESSEGEVHEALNVASVWKLPVIFVFEDNKYALSTPYYEQYAMKQFVERAQGYGLRSVIVDGNNVLEVHNTIRKLAEELRENPEPVFVECLTFRMRGHEEASGTKYVPPELFEKWSQKDPLENYEAYLRSEGILNDESIAGIRDEFKTYIEEEVKHAKEEAAVQPSAERELNSIYMPHSVPLTTPGNESRNIRFIDAVSEGLAEAMDRHPELVLMGQDIAEYGGVFKITEGFMDRYGRDRVRNTPLCESAIIGMGVGLSNMGMPVMVEMQFADFVTCGFNQIINNVAKLFYRWDQNVNMVVRMPTGAGMGAGPFHSQSNEAWFTHTPGIKVVYPSTPHDAKGLLLRSFEDPNPVMFFEHKGLYRSIQDEVPNGYYTVEIGEANFVREGRQLSIITYGMGVHWAMKATEEMNVDACILDLRSLQPLDYQRIDKAVRMSNRVLILHEDTLTGGIGGEISAYINEHLFELLDAPVMRCASLDTPVPFAPVLEADFLANSRLNETIEKLIKY